MEEGRGKIPRYLEDAELDVMYSRRKAEQGSPPRQEEGVTPMGDAQYVPELHPQLSFALTPPDSAAGWSVSPARINACPQDSDKASWHQGQTT